jgi:hypothetical protein
MEPIHSSPVKRIFQSFGAVYFIISFQGVDNGTHKPEVAFLQSPLYELRITYVLYRGLPSTKRYFFISLLLSGTFIHGYNPHSDFPSVCQRSLPFLYFNYITLAGLCQLIDFREIMCYSVDQPNLAPSSVKVYSFDNIVLSIAAFELR